MTTATRQDRRKARTRTAILDAAEKLFAATGANDVTMERIAETADVALATLYQHFGGKADLQLAVTERALQANEEDLLAAYDSGGPPLQVLIAAMAAYVRFAMEHPDAFRIIALRHGNHDADTSAHPTAVLISERVARLNSHLVATIEAGIDEGVLRPANPLDLANFLWGSLNGVLALAHRSDNLRLDRAQVTRSLAEGITSVAFGALTSAGDSLGSTDCAFRDSIHQALQPPTT